MNDILARIISTTAPKFNTNITDGTAGEILKGIPDFLDDLFRRTIADIGVTIPLSYKGYRRLTPKEEFTRSLLNNSNKTILDLAESDFYMIEFLFEYDGRVIVKPLYLPFAGDGNIMRISNTPYIVVPVLSDTVISPSYNEIFVRLLIDKFNIIGQLRTFIINGEKVPGQVVYSKIMKGTPVGDKIGKPVTPVSLYLLGKYGFAKVLRKYCNITDFIVTNENVDHLRETHNVYESTGLKPINLITPGYAPHDIKICIPMKYEPTTFLNNFIFGILYVFDILPKTADEFLYLLNGREIDGRVYPPNVKDEIYIHWRTILGRLSYRDMFSIMRITTDVKDHFNSLDTYLDNFNKIKLQNNGIMVNDFYDMLHYIMLNFDTLLLTSKEYSSDIQNRYIDITYYMTNDIIIAFNKLIQMIKRRSSRKSIVSEKEILKIFKDELKSKIIYGLISSKQGLNISISPADYVGDIKYMKCTSLLQDQNRGNGVRVNSNNSFPENTRTLRGPDLYLGSVYFLRKSCPSPRFEFNLYLDYDIHTGKINMPEDIKRAVDKLDKLLSGKVVNDNIPLLESDEVIGED